jgi:hypothetical protein
MDSFPVRAEVMQAFPLGALSALVAVASTVAAQHGIDHARGVCHELATNDQLWAFIAGRILGGAGAQDDEAPDTDRGVAHPEVVEPSGASPLQEVQIEAADVIVNEQAMPAPPKAFLNEPSAELGAQSVPAPSQPPRTRKRRGKPNGVAE